MFRLDEDTLVPPAERHLIPGDWVRITGEPGYTFGLVVEVIPSVFGFGFRVKVDRGKWGSFGRDSLLICSFTDVSTYLAGCIRRNG